MFIKSLPRRKSFLVDQRHFGTRALLRAILRTPLVIGALARCSVATVQVAGISIRRRSAVLWQCVAGIPIAGETRLRRRSKRRARRTQHYIPLLRIEQFEPRTLFDSFHFAGAATASIDVPYTLSLQTDSTSVSSWSINWGDGDTQVVSGNPSTVQHTYTGGTEVDISARATDSAGAHQATLLSPSFPSTSATVTLADGNSDFQTAVVQPGGYLLALGADSRGALTVTRYLPDGTVDASFGSGGTTSAGAVQQDWPQIATYNDGKILVSCVSLDTDTEMSCFLFARFNADGSLDSTFGDDGVLTLDTPDYVELDGMATASDGSFYFANYDQGSDGSFRMSVTHINDDGTVDSSFGDGGTTNLENYVGNGGANALALRADGHLFLGLQTDDSGATQGYVSELDSSGSILQTVPVPTDDSDSAAISVAVDSQGRVLVFSSLNSFDAGSTQVARFTSSLGVDTSFGSSGRLALTSPSSENANTFSLLGDDSFVIGGMAGSTPKAWIYSSSGALVSTTTLPVSRFAGLATEPDGHMYAFGTNDLNIASSGYVEIDNTGLMGNAIVAPEGQSSGSQDVATFDDFNSGISASDFSATIDWGDGSSSTTGTVTAAGSGVFQISGSHTYSGPGPYVTTISVHDTVRGSTWTASGSAALTPAAPSDVHQVAPITYADAISLAWTNNSALSVTYIVERSTNGVSFTQIGTSSSALYEDRHLAPSTTYYYRVKAVAGSGTSGYSSVGSASTAALVATITPSPTTLVEGGSLSLAVSTNTVDASTYLWDLDGDGIYGETGAAATRGDETAQSVTVNTSGLDGPGTYVADVQATASGDTVTAEIDVPIVNAPPTLTLSGDATTPEGSAYTLHLASSDPGPDTISSWSIDWGDGDSQTVLGNPSSLTHVYADGDASYTVQATATDEDGTYAASPFAVSVLNVPPTIALQGRPAVNSGDDYTLTLGDVSDPGTDTATGYIVDWGDGQSDSYSERGAVTHLYVSDDDGGSLTHIVVGVIDEDGTHMDAGTEDVQIYNPPLPTPATPEGLSADADDLGNITISWSIGDTAYLSGFTVESSDDGLDFSDLSTVSASTTSLLITNAPEDELRYYRVRGFNDAIDSDESSTASATAALRPPTSLSVEEASSTGLTLTWTDNSNAETNYLVSESTDGIYFVPVATTDADATVYAVENLSPSSRYWFEVQAINDDAQSIPSNVATAQTLAPLMLSVNGPSSVAAGQTYVLNLISSDATRVSGWSINWGDGTTSTAAADATSVSHVFTATAPQFTIDVVGHTSEGDITPTPVDVDVLAVSANPGISGRSTASPDANYVLSLSPRTTALTNTSYWLINWGDGSVSSVDATASSATHEFSLSGTVIIGATLVLDSGSFDANTITVDVGSTEDTLTALSDVHLAHPESTGSTATDTPVLTGTLEENPGDLDVIEVDVNGDGVADYAATPASDGTVTIDLSGVIFAPGDYTVRYRTVPGTNTVDADDTEWANFSFTLDAPATASHPLVPVPSDAPTFEFGVFQPSAPDPTELGVVAFWGGNSVGGSTLNRFNLDGTQFADRFDLAPTVPDSNDIDSTFPSSSASSSDETGETLTTSSASLLWTLDEAPSDGGSWTYNQSFDLTYDRTIIFTGVDGSSSTLHQWGEQEYDLSGWGNAASSNYSLQETASDHYTYSWSAPAPDPITGGASTHSYQSNGDQQYSFNSQGESTTYAGTPTVTEMDTLTSGGDDDYTNLFHESGGPDPDLLTTHGSTWDYQWYSPADVTGAGEFSYDHHITDGYSVTTLTNSDTALSDGYSGDVSVVTSSTTVSSTTTDLAIYNSTPGDLDDAHSALLPGDLDASAVVVANHAVTDITNDVTVDAHTFGEVLDNSRENIFGDTDNDLSTHLVDDGSQHIVLDGDSMPAGSSLGYAGAMDSTSASTATSSVHNITGLTGYDNSDPDTSATFFANQDATQNSTDVLQATDHSTMEISNDDVTSTSLTGYSSEYSTGTNSWSNSGGSTSDGTVLEDDTQTFIDVSSHNTDTGSGSFSSDQSTDYSQSDGGELDSLGTASFVSTSTGDLDQLSSTYMLATSTNSPTDGLTITNTASTTITSDSPSHYVITKSGGGTFHNATSSSDQTIISTTTGTNVLSSTSGSASSVTSDSRTTGVVTNSTLTSTFSDNRVGDTNSDETQISHEENQSQTLLTDNATSGDSGISSSTSSNVGTSTIDDYSDPTIYAHTVTSINSTSTSNGTYLDFGDSSLTTSPTATTTLSHISNHQQGTFNSSSDQSADSVRDQTNDTLTSTLTAHLDSWSDGTGTYSDDATSDLSDSSENSVSVYSIDVQNEHGTTGSDSSSTLDMTVNSVTPDSVISLTSASTDSEHDGGSYTQSDTDTSSFTSLDGATSYLTDDNSTYTESGTTSADTTLVSVENDKTFQRDSNNCITYSAISSTTINPSITHDGGTYQIYDFSDTYLSSGDFWTPTWGASRSDLTSHTDTLTYSSNAQATVTIQDDSQRGVDGSSTTTIGQTTTSSTGTVQSTDLIESGSAGDSEGAPVGTGDTSASSITDDTTHQIADNTLIYSRNYDHSGSNPYVAVSLHITASDVNSSHTDDTITTHATDVTVSDNPGYDVAGNHQSSATTTDTGTFNSSDISSDRTLSSTSYIATVNDGLETHVHTSDSSGSAETDVTNGSTYWYDTTSSTYIFSIPNTGAETWRQTESDDNHGNTNCGTATEQGSTMTMTDVMTVTAPVGTVTVTSTSVNSDAWGDSTDSASSHDSHAWTHHDDSTMSNTSDFANTTDTSHDTSTAGPSTQTDQQIAHTVTVYSGNDTRVEADTLSSGYTGNSGSSSDDFASTSHVVNNDISSQWNDDGTASSTGDFASSSDDSVSHWWTDSSGPSYQTTYTEVFDASTSQSGHNVTTDTAVDNYTNQSGYSDSYDETWTTNGTFTSITNSDSYTTGTSKGSYTVGLSPSTKVTHRSSSATLTDTGTFSEDQLTSAHVTQSDAAHADTTSTYIDLLTRSYVETSHEMDHVDITDTGGLNGSEVSFSDIANNTHDSSANVYETADHTVYALNSDSTVTDIDETTSPGKWSWHSDSTLINDAIDHRFEPGTLIFEDYTQTTVDDGLGTFSTSDDYTGISFSTSASAIVRDTYTENDQDSGEQQTVTTGTLMAVSTYDSGDVHSETTIGTGSLDSVIDDYSDLENLTAITAQNCAVTTSQEGSPLTLTNTSGTYDHQASTDAYIHQYSGTSAAPYEFYGTGTTTTDGDSYDTNTSRESYGVDVIVDHTVTARSTTYLDGSVDAPPSHDCTTSHTSSTQIAATSHHQYLSYDLAAIDGYSEFNGQSETVHFTYDYQLSADYGDQSFDRTGEDRRFLDDTLAVVTHSVADVSFADTEYQEPDNSYDPVTHDYHHTYDSQETTGSTTEEYLTSGVPQSSDAQFDYELSSSDQKTYDYSVTDASGSVTATADDQDAVYADNQTHIQRAWDTASYSDSQWISLSSRTVNDDSIEPQCTPYEGFTQTMDGDVTTGTYIEHDVAEHAVSGGGAVLDEDYALSVVSHTGDQVRDWYTWDEPVIGHGESITTTHVDDSIKDESVLGGTVSHQVTQNGYTETIGWSDNPPTSFDTGDIPADSLGDGWSRPDTESTVLASYALPDDPSGAYGGFQSGLDDLITASGLHDLVFPPPAQAPWYAPWESPNFSWWSVAQWISPISHLEAIGINFLSSQLQNLADYASSNGYVALGTVLGMSADLGHIGASIVDLPGTLVNLAQASTMAGERAAGASGSDLVGALAGVGYFAGSLVGATQITEGIVGEDFATGAQLDSVESASRIFGGISALASAGAAGIEMAGLDTCIPGTPKLFKDGCFTEGTLVLASRGRAPIEQLGIGRRMIVDPQGATPRLQPFIDITQWRVLRLEYVRPDTQQVLHMAFLRAAVEADQLSPGDTTPVVIEELGVEGRARVVAVEPCPALEEGQGELITGTFMQEHIDVRLLKLEGLEEPIEVTGVHLIYSEDQHTYVPVKELARGERLRTRTGTAVVESILRKHGSWRVYNLEIGRVHRYYVSELDVLVHNMCDVADASNFGTFERGDPALDIGDLEHYRYTSPKGDVYDVHMRASMDGDTLVIDEAHIQPQTGWSENIGSLGRQGLRDLTAAVGDAFDTSDILLNKVFRGPHGAVGSFGPIRATRINGNWTFSRP